MIRLAKVKDINRITEIINEGKKNLPRKILRNGAVTIRIKM